ncbi:DUF1349 domain-containing protein [Mangrovibacillus cuniculi]|nr:DUF1349 domain-containing protein [Mangrovibacillus cuniculi]
MTFITFSNLNLTWMNTPKSWSIDENTKQLVIKPEDETDYWQRTHYDFQHDNGHFLFQEQHGPFQLKTKVHLHPLHQYDQAGLYIRFDADNWVKASIEFMTEGENKLGAVVTKQGFSDWSTQPIGDDVTSISFRLSYIDPVCYIDYSLDEINWYQIRIGHLPMVPKTVPKVGLYACSPIKAGFSAAFDYLEIHSISDDRTKVYG